MGYQIEICRRHIARLPALAAALALACHAALAQPAPQPPAQWPIISDAARTLPVIAPNGMVASQEAKASRIGVQVLERGGNAVDAAVAVGFALAVTLPRAGNIGGGGFMLVHLAEGNRTVAIDYRETAPAASTPTMFLGPNGEPDPRLSRDSGLAAGVPGTVAGLAEAHKRYGSGRFTLAQLIQPAITLAREGIVVDEDLADSLPRAAPRFQRFPASQRIFLKPDGSAPRRGETLVQADLARSLEAVAQRGPAGFYDGATAERIVAALAAHGGIMTAADLSGYRPVIREVVRGRYKGYEIASMPPPSSGGVHLVQLLNLLEPMDLGSRGHNSAESIHLMVEAMKLAYADRARYLGDPDSVQVPVAGLTSRAYAAALRPSINPDRARPSVDIRPGDPAPYEGEQTTHFSVVDRFGNAVANTYTLNFSYGLGLVADGTGIILNNEMDDFAAKAGASNAFGLVQGSANLPGPGKRPLSSMTPTILFRDGKVAMVTGSPGGSRIITITLQTILNVVDHGMNIAEAVAAPRIHHQWLPDAIDVEQGVSVDTLRLLAARGHRIMPRPAFGNVNAILATAEGWTGAADPRQRGTLAVGH
ncbi:gamma-glutamyltransferase [Phreatobacter aquaticus]|uniref:Glutathione hydrolase proenzyme n=1 Tax=Phreatobacter aquaticus TaxID=2570229 RepID=A0A4D7QLI2_9HYPH|nr:gamma-glutamyltransferase [Phreatobacter aquaticus]QCK88630.1 gamma-glutamyltransferase [Phreatobacter aquaticus]